MEKIQAIVNYANKELLFQALQGGGMTPVSIRTMKDTIYLIVGYPESANELEELLGVTKDSNFYIGTWDKSGNQYIWPKEFSYRGFKFQDYWDALNDIKLLDDEGEPTGETRRPIEEEALNTQVSSISGWGIRILN